MLKTTSHLELLFTCEGLFTFAFMASELNPPQLAGNHRPVCVKTTLASVGSGYIAMPQFRLSNLSPSNAPSAYSLSQWCRRFPRFQHRPSSLHHRRYILHHIGNSPIYITSTMPTDSQKQHLEAVAAERERLEESKEVGRALFDAFGSQKFRLAGLNASKWATAAESEPCSQKAESPARKKSPVRHKAPPSPIPAPDTVAKESGFAKTAVVEDTAAFMEAVYARIPQKSAQEKPQQETGMSTDCMGFTYLDMHRSLFCTVDNESTETPAVTKND